MLAIFDLDVRPYARPGPDGPAAHGRAGLARVGNCARFAALCGIDAIGVVERFSAMHGPGVLQALSREAHAPRPLRAALPPPSCPGEALQGAARAEGGLIAAEPAARV